jgi:hypothetical protein
MAFTKDAPLRVDARTIQRLGAKRKRFIDRLAADVCFLPIK